MSSSSLPSNIRIALPILVRPPGVSVGSVATPISVSGKATFGSVLKVMQQSQAVSSAEGSFFNSFSSSWVPWLTASMGAPVMEPDVSSSR